MCHAVIECDCPHTSVVQVRHGRGLVNVDMLTRDINALLVYNMLTYILYMYVTRGESK